jgi:hypothetical protein
MTHFWGDDWPHWGDLNSAVHELSDFARRWGRLGIHTKEKWGCLRASTYWAHDLHSIIWPGYVYAQWQYHLPESIAKRVWWLDVYVWPRILRFTPLGWYQRKIYGLAYRRICKKYPHIIDEILQDAEYPELIGWEAEGVHGSYWTWPED